MVADSRKGIKWILINGNSIRYRVLEMYGEKCNKTYICVCITTSLNLPT